MSNHTRSIAVQSAMDEEEYASMSKLLQEFTSIPAIDKAWTFKSETEDASTGMFLLMSSHQTSRQRKRSRSRATQLSRKATTVVKSNLCLLLED
ncbi:acylamino-acid-releasing enzyme 2-like [Salvia miltiorrhiza]|uniref:acylamino-acid-releasing enzyme 2-like n=1 Tax=Salvia miltiorrhiza TaxID=226208 RepID=UPI0025AD0664|nr:acylamino-acid-releasing enzyme 2-like [Salvia miltiorrhiza]